MELLGNIDLPHTYSHIRDFGRGLVTLAEDDEADGQAWHIPAAPTLSTRQLAQMVATQAGATFKPRIAGPTLITLLGLFNPTIREFKEMMYEFQEPYVMDHSRFAAVFGDQATPHEQAIEETLAWYRQHLS
jgi:nucleoside-diphosphate-sugar epimerase